MSAKEIAGLIDALKSLASWPGSPYEKAAAALRALAQENERMKVGIAFGNDLLPALQQRIRELEAENERLKARDIEQFATTDQWLKRIVELEAEMRRFQNNEVNDCDLLGMHERRIAELEAVERELRTALGSAINDRDGFWKERDALRAALKPFAEYAERIEKERPGQFHDGFAIDVLFKVITRQSAADVPMAWFIAALKAYRGEDSKTEDKTLVATLTSTDIDNDRCPACGKALSRLTTSLLPDEIAGLIERSRKFLLSWTVGPNTARLVDLANELTEALRALAQENERVTNELATLVAEFNARGMERDGLRAKCATLEEHIRELKAERDAKVP